jgi:hypothetical protein
VDSYFTNETFESRHFWSFFIKAERHLTFGCSWVCQIFTRLLHIWIRS